MNEATEQKSNAEVAGLNERLVTRQLTKRQYLANCMWHIQDSECHISRQWERDEDIADAILVAAESGVDHAHDYLVNLAEQAKKGKYKEAV